MKKSRGIVIANFGGPRHLDEIQPFLTELLTDRDVVRTHFPSFIHNYLFKRVAKKRSTKVAHDYKSIGGKSPIYEDTENVAKALQMHFSEPLLTFHRYLPATHKEFAARLNKLSVEEIRVFPMFPQFTYATTGSIARWFGSHLPAHTVARMRWVKSYAAHPSFVQVHQRVIRSYLQQQGLQDDQTILLFSAHGIPQLFVETGDLYEDECQSSFQAIMKGFPGVLGRLSYQSKFGPGEWLKPYTIDVCKDIRQWCEGRKHVVFVPLSFTSDHIETLFEVETEYMPVIREASLHAYRVPGLTLHPEWINAIVDILSETNLCSNQMLIRKSN